MIGSRRIAVVLGVAGTFALLHGCAASDSETSTGSGWGGAGGKDAGTSEAAAGQAGTSVGGSAGASGGGSAGASVGGSAGESQGGSAGESSGGAAGTGGGIAPEPQPEAGVEAGIEAGTEAGVEAGPDASDAATEAAPCVGPCIGAGLACTSDDDCESKLCKAVLLGNADQKVCVAPCTQQSDCVQLGTGLFCEPVSALSSSGYCVPRSPAHCLSCASDGDCGVLSEVCTQASGDQVKACHVDCSIAGAAACPSDYQCVSLQVGGVARMLCRPNVPFCLDANGGFCDRVTAPQACIRTNSAGMCVGQRTCLSGPERFTACNALAPACKATCSAQNQAGCDEQYCPDAANLPTSCGTCDNDCTTKTVTTTANAKCEGMPAACAFSCKGERYNVDKSFANGCEVVDSPVGNHTEATATAGPTYNSCTDGDSTFQFSGTIVSDSAVHENASVPGFNVGTGSAPDWMSVRGMGQGICQNNFDVTLTVSGSSSPSCYKLTFITDNLSESCTTNVAGACTVSSGMSSYSDGALMHAVVEKTCSSAALVEKVTYTVGGHL